MKISNIFKGISNAVGKLSKRKVSTNSYSQDYVLSLRMKCEEITHDQKVKADIMFVRLDTHWTDNHKKSIIYFCPTQSVRVHSTIQQGDGGELPRNVKMDDIWVPKKMKKGLYNLRNVEIHSNGVISLATTPETQWEYAGE